MYDCFMVFTLCSCALITWVTPMRWSSIDTAKLYVGHATYLLPTTGCGVFSVSMILKATQSLTLGSGWLRSVLIRTTASPSRKSPLSILSQSSRFSSGLWSLWGHALPSFLSLLHSSGLHRSTYAAPISNSLLTWS